jgi:hypothetical protein
MRLSLRIVLLTALASLALATAGPAAAGSGSGKWGKVSAAKHGAGQAQAPAGSGSSAAAGQGAATSHGECQIPGLPPIQGTGNIVVNQSGTNFTCHGELPAGEPAPDRPVKNDDGDCITLVTPSGQVKLTCHSKSP